jgi:hypothetical protein
MFALIARGHARSFRSGHELRASLYVRHSLRRLLTTSQYTVSVSAGSSYVTSVIYRVLFAYGIYVSMYAASSVWSPLRDAPSSIRALWLPNCIARFRRELASTKPSSFAARRNNILSPAPSPSRGSSLTCTGSAVRNATTLSERNGYRDSLP